MLRIAAIFLTIAWAAAAGSPQTEGEALFRECEFKAAARSFEHALVNEPGNARLQFWLGKSYARLADVSSPLTARRNARKARTHLEIAVRLEPGNAEFAGELFELYAESPEWFDGGLKRASAMLERFGPDDGGPGTPSRILAESQGEHSGAAWALRKGIARTSGWFGYLVP